MSQVLQAENLTGPVAYHGEGPIWSASWGGLRWVDMLSGMLLTLRSGQVHRLAIDDPIAAFVRPRRSGGYVVGTERGIALANEPDSPPTQYLQFWHEHDVRMNDGTTTPDGRLLAGSTAYNAAKGRGSVYAVESDLSSSVALSAVGLSNGIGFSPNGKLVYYIDSVTHQILVFDYSEGKLLRGRTFVEIDPAAGLPDGLTIAADGSVWVALWGGYAVRGYTPQGVLATVVELPVSQVSACTFGGPHLNTLFITTSRQDLDEHDEPQAGSVFWARPGQTGLPVVEFAG